MANISVADGTIELSRKFYDENKALINNWVMMITEIGKMEILALTT